MDYGIKSRAPWYVRLPIVGMLSSSRVLDVSLTTFTHGHEPLTGVFGAIRVPFRLEDGELRLHVPMSFCIPDIGHCLTFGIWARMTVRGTEDRKGGTPRGIGFWLVPQNKSVCAGRWYDCIVDVDIKNGCGDDNVLVAYHELQQ